MEWTHYTPEGRIKHANTNSQLVPKNLSAGNPLDVIAMNAAGDDVEWSRDGIRAGQTKYTSTWSSGALGASGIANTGIQLVVTHDGVHGLELEASLNVITSASTVCRVEIWSGVVGSGTIHGRSWLQLPAVNYRGHAIVKGFAAAAAADTAVTYSIAVAVSAAATIQGDSSAIGTTHPSVLTATWRD